MAFPLLKDANDFKDFKDLDDVTTDGLDDSTT